MVRILVADKIAEAGMERLRAAPGVSFDVRHGLSPAELAGAAINPPILSIRTVFLPPVSNGPAAT